MITVKMIASAIAAFAPEALAADFDNVGLLLGRSDKEVKTVLLCLDVDENTAAEAVEAGADLIVSHHPVIFHAIRRITDETPTGRMLMTLFKNDIAVISAHTNLDTTEDGLNDQMAKKLGLNVVGDLETGEGEHTCGRICEADTTLSRLAETVKNAYGLPFIRHTGDGDRKISRIALCTGGGRSLTKDVSAKNCDVYISGDLHYADIRELALSGIDYIEIGHFDSERPVTELFDETLHKAFPSLRLIRSGEQNILKTIL